MRNALFLIVLVSLCGCAQHHIVHQELTSAQIRPLSELKTVNDIRVLNNQASYLDRGEAVPLQLSIDSEWLGLRQDHVDLIAKRRIYFRFSVPEDMSGERMERLLSLDAQKLSNMSDAEREQLFKDVMLYLSSDAVHWAPLNDTKALKEVFELQGGSVSLGMGMNATEGVWTSLALRVLSKP